MKELSIKIKESGLLKSYLANKVGVSSAHLSMMLNGKATMPEHVRNSLNRILDSVIKATI